MSVTMIPFAEGEANLKWLDLCDAFERGHAMQKAEIADTLLYRGKDTLLNRSAWIDGLGLAVKCASVFPGNPAKGQPMINGVVNLFDDAFGTLEAIIDFHLVTKWKTAGDSLFAARRLARPDSENILIVGAGTVGRSLWQAYRAQWPDARYTVWNRTRANAEEMAADCPGLSVADDLEAAVRAADIVTSATMSTDAFIKGEWFRPGQHIDLIGAYRPDMREADDTAMARARIFVDSRETTVDHIGELMSPIAAGVIAPSDIVADLYQPGAFERRSEDEITLFKNGGGAHLDLMTSRYILDAWQANP
ncbi:ornithine cyclodeaminase [Pelagivirga sediminicola]|uniref:Ornithine cyclodeaminase n=1 Tax=Pelagivirga sediminicola TaxID=2170575 RepID=A0A2T7G619_9RHOB|nr:ornithine cyclodeaminase [Pelagivirga sediminicola]PVA09875.1 ornithine cyclodeaminase [Pelagivirga sediminicola]